MSDVILNLIFLLVSIAGAIYCIQLLKSFSYMNLEELRRRSASGSEAAQRVLTAREYGLRVWFVLWLVLALMLVIIMNVLGNLLPTFLAVLAGAAILAGITFVLPWARWSARGLTPAARISPALAAFLKKAEPFFNLFHPLGLSQKIGHEPPLNIHSKENLVDIISSLKNRVSQIQAISDLELAIAILQSNSKKIKIFMTPIKSVQSVKFDQKLSPQVINNLHKSGQQAFPVLRKKNQYSGFIYLEDIQERQDKKSLAAQEIMKERPGYLNSKMPLNEVVNAFLQTKQKAFLVVNDSKTIEGMISIEDVLKCFFSKKQLSDFKDYSDLELTAGSKVNKSSPK